MPGQQVSPEVALPFFRQRCSELQDENILLRARGAELEEGNAALEQQLTEARREIEQLRAQPPAGKAPQPLACADQDALA